MKYEIGGFWARSPNYGMKFVPLRYGDLVDLEDLPCFLGNTPVGLSCWYGQPPLEEITVVGDTLRESVGLCPLRGSVAGIASLEASGRVMAYDYYFAEWAGRRFARWCKNTGNRILVLKTSQPRSDLNHHQCNKILAENFKDGFEIGYLGCSNWRETLGMGRDEIDCEFFQKVDVKSRKLESCSFVVCVNLSGLSMEQKKVVKDMAANLVSINSIENAKEEEVA